MRGLFPRPLSALAAAGVAALLCGGCFVFDEFDEGQKLMEQHAPGGERSKAPEPEAGATKEGPGFLERAQSALARVPEALRAAANGLSGAVGGGDSPDSAEQMVRCEIGGSLLFTRRTDCEARGGRVAGEIRARSPDA